MQTKTYELKNLVTDYKINGNSSERPIDTLAIAIDGRDYNDCLESNYDYIADQEEYARTYLLAR